VAAELASTVSLGQTLHAKRKPPRSPIAVIATLNTVNPISYELFGKSIMGQARTNPESTAAKYAIEGKITRTIRNLRMSFPELDMTCYASSTARKIKTPDGQHLRVYPTFSPGKPLIVPRRLRSRSPSSGEDVG
jgi:hypothetical protein